MESAIESSQEISAICAALAKAQSKIKNAVRDAENPHYNSTYSTLAGVWDAVREPLTENELSIMQGEKVRTKEDLSSGEVDVTTMLLHSSGQWFRTTITLPVVPMARRKKRDNDDGDNDADRTPGKVTPQAVGSAITYGRRYGLESMAGTAPEAEDDDGIAASGKAQVEAIPSNGIFEDVIESATSKACPRKDGSSFTVYTIKTGSHGLLECYEAVGVTAATFAGTGQMVSLKAEKGKYGWRLLNVRPVEAKPAEQSVDAPKEQPIPEEIDPDTGLPFSPGITKARAWIKKEISFCQTIESLNNISQLMQKTGGAYLSPKVTCLVTAAIEKMNAKEMVPA